MYFYYHLLTANFPCKEDTPKQRVAGFLESKAYPMQPRRNKKPESESAKEEVMDSICHNRSLPCIKNPESESAEEEVIDSSSQHIFLPPVVNPEPESVEKGMLDSTLHLTSLPHIESRAA